MNETSKLPFFINTRRLERDDSYFDIGRTQERLRKLLVTRRNDPASLVGNNEDWEEEYGAVGFYGVSRFINLEDDKDQVDSEDEDQLDELDEDEQYDRTSGFQLFWMTFKKIAASIGERLLSRHPRRRSDDVEYNPSSDAFSQEDLCKIVVEPSLMNFPDPRIKDDMIIYGDVNYLIQKFRMELRCGSLDVALFSLELPRTALTQGESTDLQTFVVSPECGSYMWIENGRASAIFMTKSSEDFFGSVMEWFRKILSDMVLADSVMMGHPYYWHPALRRRLTRVMKYLKRLYRNLAKRERQRLRVHPQSNAIRTDKIELLCPTEISKIVINEQPSRNLIHATTTYDKLNVMLEQLVKKWFDYHYNLEQCQMDNVQDVAKTYTILNPQHNTSDEVLESVTFLDFFPDVRHYPPETRSSSTESIPVTTNNRQSTPTNCRNKYNLSRSASMDSYTTGEMANAASSSSTQPSYKIQGQRSKYHGRDRNDSVDEWDHHHHPSRLVDSEVFETSKCEEVDSEMSF